MLDLDHVGAEIGEYHACARARNDMAQFEDPDTLQGQALFAS
jgi:hypothetical protein